MEIKLHPFLTLAIYGERWYIRSGIYTPYIEYTEGCVISRCRIILNDGLRKNVELKSSGIFYSF
jgi:hypothetical protein